MFVFTEKSWRRGPFRKCRSSVMESETRCGGGGGSLSRAGRMRALGSKPSGRPKLERCSDTVRGEVWRHLQSTAGVPLSKLPNPQKGTCNPLSKDGPILDRLSPPQLPTMKPSLHGYSLQHRHCCLLMLLYRHTLSNYFALSKRIKRDHDCKNNRTG